MTKYLNYFKNECSLYSDIIFRYVLTQKILFVIKIKYFIKYCVVPKDIQSIYLPICAV